MKNSEKSKRNGTISAFIKRPYHAGTRLVVALVLTLTVASVVAAQGLILHIYLPIIPETFSGGQVSDASGSGAALEQVDLSADTGSGDNSGVPAAQQPPLDCENLPPDANHGTIMKCKHQKLADTICETKDLVNADQSGIFTVKQKERLTKQCESSQEWVKAPGRDREFEEAFKKANTQCYVEEIDNDGIGDDDGICTQGEKHKGGCLEDDEDNIGDNDGICEELNKKKGKKTWEACLTTCDVEGSEAGGEADLIDTSRAEVLENAVDDAAETLADLNGQLENMTEALRVERGALDELSLPYEPEQCTGLLLYKADPKFASPMANDEYNNDREDRPFSYETLNDWRLADNYVEAGQICDDVWAVSWSGGIGAEVGGSSQWWCVFFHYADYIVQDVANGLELLDDLITGTRIDNAVQCLQTVKKDLDEANDKLDKLLRVDLQVTELKEKSEFLVGATVGGNPASGVEFISVKVADSSISFLDVTGYMNYTEVDPGMYRVLIDLPQEAKNAQIFAFQVSARTWVGNEELPLSGFTHFHRGTQ